MKKRRLYLCPRLPRRQHPTTKTTTKQRRRQPMWASVGFVGGGRAKPILDLLGLRLWPRRQGQRTHKKNTATKFTKFRLGRLFRGGPERKRKTGNLLKRENRLLNFSSSIFLWSPGVSGPRALSGTAGHPYCMSKQGACSATEAYGNRSTDDATIHYPTARPWT